MKKAIIPILAVLLAGIPLLSRDGGEPAYSSSIALYEEAQKNYEKGQYREALQLLRQALEKNPAFSRAHLLSGKASLEISDYERALLHFDRVLSSDPNSLDARIGKGRALTGLDRPTEAETIFQEVKEKDPGNADNLYGLARLRMMAGREDLARKYLQLILRKDPAYREALQDMAILETSAGRLESGEEYLKKATAVDPAHGSLAVTRGIVLSLQAEFAGNESDRLALKDEAADAFRTAIRENPGPELMKQIIRLDIERGYPEEGLELLEEIRSQDSGDDLLRLSANLSQALFHKTGERKYLEQTMHELKALCQQAPQDPLACFRLEMLGLDYTGTAELRNFLAGRHMAIARDYEEDLRYGLRISHLKQAMRLSPGNPDVEQKLLDVYRAGGDFQSYLETLVALRDQNPEEPLWQYRVERALQEKGKYLSYREELLGYSARSGGTHRPSVILVMDFANEGGNHWNGEAIISRAIEDAINDRGKLISAGNDIKSDLRDFMYARRALEEREIQSRIESDYRPLLFDASYFRFLDELDRKDNGRIRFIISGSYRSSPGRLEIEYVLSDRFTGKEVLKGKAIASGQDALYRASFRIAAEIARVTPVRGEIVKIKDDQVFIHAGSKDGVKEGQVFYLDTNQKKTFRVVELDTSFSALAPEQSGDLLSPGMVLLSNPRRP